MILKDEIERWKFLQSKELTGSSLQHSNHRTHAEIGAAPTPLSVL